MYRNFVASSAGDSKSKISSLYNSRNDTRTVYSACNSRNSSNRWLNERGIIPDNGSYKVNKLNEIWEQKVRYQVWSGNVRLPTKLNRRWIFRLPLWTFYQCPFVHKQTLCNYSRPALLRSADGQYFCKRRAVKKFESSVPTTLIN